MRDELVASGFGLAMAVMGYLAAWLRQLAAKRRVVPEEDPYIFRDSRGTVIIGCMHGMVAVLAAGAERKWCRRCGAIHDGRRWREPGNLEASGVDTDPGVIVDD